MQTIPMSLKSRAHAILQASKGKPLGDQMHACSIAARACARAAQIEGDGESFARHMMMASKFAHLSETVNFDTYKH